MAIAITGSIKIVDAGYRGVLLTFGAVDTTRSLNEGIHFVVPVRDNVVQMEVRTQRITEDVALCLQRPSGRQNTSSFELSSRS